jgi:oxygen-dependent protoporphyrinogen oxidase
MMVTGHTAAPTRTQTEFSKERICKVAVIGGGITGLAAAYRLTKLLGVEDVILLESSARLGGVILTKKENDYLFEGGPDSFLCEKDIVLNLCRELGLSDSLLPTNKENRRAFVALNQKLYPLPKGFRLLAPAHLIPFFITPLLSWSAKLRMILDLVIPRKTDMPDESLAEFVRRRFGHQALDRIAQPLAAGIYLADPEKLSMKAALPRFIEMERRYGSIIAALRAERKKKESGTAGVRYGSFLTLKGGLDSLVNALASRIPRQNILMSARVASLSRTNSSWCIKTEGKRTVLADAVIIATPAPQAARLLSHIFPDSALEISAIKYVSSCIVNLVFERRDIAHKLDGFGFVVPLSEQRTIAACSFSSVKFSGRSPDNQVILRAFIGNATTPELCNLSNDLLLSKVIEDLNSYLGLKSNPLYSWLQRWPHSMPQYEIGHLDRVANIEAAIADSGIFLAGNAYRGVGLPDCIADGERAANLASVFIRSFYS